MLEVCVDSFESAMAAIAGGAGRLELCSALSEGGLTPSPGLVKTVKKCAKIPVYAMLRPRCGSDFIYSKSEIDIILYDIKELKQCEADGFVFGALNEDKTIDEVSCKTIITACKPYPVTFHRAFDVCADPFAALETVITLGFERILTSGAEITADKGIDLIKDLINKANDRICIMPGSGININNVVDIMTKTGAKEVHGSCRIKKNPIGSHSIPMGGDKDNDILYICNKDAVSEIVRRIEMK